MSAPTTSLVAVSKHDALRAALAMLKTVEESRAKEREETIVSLTKERGVRLTGWWPSYRAYTRTEAETLVDSEKLNGWGLRNDYSWWRIRGWGTKAVAERLMSACNLTQDDRVWLNLDDAHELASYLS